MTKTFTQKLRLIRLQPFDTTTASGRSQERLRLAALSIAASLLHKLALLALALLTIRLTLPYLGAERFGIWMTLSSFCLLFSFLDLGVGNALVNVVSKQAAQSSPEPNSGLTQPITAGVSLLALIGMVSSVVLLLLKPLVPWSLVFKQLDPALLPEVENAATCFAIFFGVNLFSTGLRQIFVGLQRAYLGHLVALVAVGLSTFTLIVFAHNQAGIAALFAATFGLQAALPMLLLLPLLSKRLLNFSGASKALRQHGKNILGSGGLFFVLQVTALIAWGADSLILSASIGAGAVAVFAVTNRVFQLAVQPLSLMNAPLWPAYHDAFSRGDFAFIRHSLKTSLLITFGLASVIVGILIASQSALFQLLTDGKLSVPSEFVQLFGIWIVVNTVGNAFSMFLNGIGIVQEQVFVALSLLVVILPVKIIAVQYWGLNAIPIASLACYISVVGIGYGVVFRKSILDRINNTAA